MKAIIMWLPFIIENMKKNEMKIYSHTLSFLYYQMISRVQNGLIIIYLTTSRVRV